MTDLRRIEALLVEAAHFVRRSMLDARRYRGRERRETSITDDLIVRLTKRGEGLVIAADAPGPESLYGADLELWLRGGGLLLGLRLQAKSLAPRKRKLGVYKELHHVVHRRTTSGTTHPRAQVDVLISGTPHYLTPGYVFYNALEQKPSVDSACCSFNGYERLHGRLALTYTSASVVRDFNRMDPRPNSISDILPASVPLQCLALCGGRRWWAWGSGGPLPMPLQAAELPLALAGGRPPTVFLDPTRDVDATDLERLATYPVTYDPALALPAYVTSLLTNRRMSPEEQPTASKVVILGD